MMNINQFTARATDEVPPRVAIEFAPGNSFQKDGIPCPNFAVRGHRQITVHLGNKRVMNEAVGDLASATDCGKVLTVWPDGQNTYTYVSDNEASERVNLSQVTLQLQGASLFAKFEAGGAAAAPVAPIMPGSQVPAPVGQAAGGVNAPVPANVQGANKYAILAAKLQAGEIPYPKLSSMVAPNAPAPAVVAAPQPSVTPLRGNLPQETFSNKRLTGTLYKDYQWYVKNTNPPSSSREKADYDLLYPIFLREERLYATLQERLTAIAAQTTLTFIIPLNELSNFFHGSREEIIMYKIWGEIAASRGHPHDEVKSNIYYQGLVQAEKDYLAKQARNEYNSAN